jgi:hypothetical protein
MWRQGFSFNQFLRVLMLCGSIWFLTSAVSSQELSAAPRSASMSTESAKQDAQIPIVVAEPCQGIGCGGCGAEFDFKGVPPIWPAPRTGNFSIPPSGSGYYSFLDALHGEYREASPKYGYPSSALMPPSFINADFRYLDDPKNTSHDYLDPLKRIHLGDDWLFSTGGQVWNRYMNEENSRLTQADNTYNLFRTRVYGDLWYQDKVRVFAEFITAQDIGHDLAPLPIDVNKADLLNAFVDIKVGEYEGKPIYVRIGRQELLLGSQRLISTLDWANTRRTFQGVSAFRQGEKWDTELFWVQPVPPNADRFDSVDNNQNFAGAWFTYRPEKGQTWDFYYLFLDNTNNAAQQGIVRTPYNVHTLGTRTAGDKNNILWDGEFALQLGERGSESIIAGMVTLGGGYHFENVPLNPTLWVYYDYATGDSHPNSGDFHTFNELFPFGHYYLGWTDLIGRQNIQDLNAHLYLYPSNWITLFFQYHHFWLAEAQDALYNAAGNAYRRSPTGAAGRDVGDELDVVVNFHVTRHTDVMFGYGKLYGGSFLERTAGPNRAVDSDLLFLLCSYRW